MNDLVPVKISEKGKQTVMARQLHGFLETGTDFRHWFPRMCEYGFGEGKDFNPVIFDQVQNEGARLVTRTMTDYEMTIEMAKEICMVQRTEKGKMARQYFIELENAWNSPEQIMNRALMFAQKSIANYEQQVKELIPKAEVYDQLASSDNALSIAEVAKIIGIPKIGPTTLYRLLREQKILMYKDGHNLPYQKYIDNGCFKVVEKPFTKANGRPDIDRQTYVYQKGVEFIFRKLQDLGVVGKFAHPNYEGEAANG